MNLCNRIKCFVFLLSLCACGDILSIAHTHSMFQLESVSEFPTLFRSLDAGSGVEGVSVSMTTLEEVGVGVGVVLDWCAFDR